MSYILSGNSEEGLSAHFWWKRVRALLQPPVGPVETAASSGLWKNSTSRHCAMFVLLSQTVMERWSWGLLLMGPNSGRESDQAFRNWATEAKVPSVLLHYIDGSHSYIFSMALMSVLTLWHCNPVALAGS